VLHRLFASGSDRAAPALGVMGLKAVIA